MPLAYVGAAIRLKVDVPTRGLRCDDNGVVVSLWLAPGDFFYEVEFLRPGESPATRVLLRADQLEVVE